MIISLAKSSKIDDQDQNEMNKSDSDHFISFTPIFVLGKWSDVLMKWSKGLLIISWSFTSIFNDQCRNEMN